jgi:hypothetical protein
MKRVGEMTFWLHKFLFMLGDCVVS